MGIEYFIASDNTKNSCCGDYKALNVVEGDVILKVGYSCLYDGEKSDVLYLFDREESGF